jgi:hypothetical protein
VVTVWDDGMGEAWLPLVMHGPKTLASQNGANLPDRTARLRQGQPEVQKKSHQDRLGVVGTSLTFIATCGGAV